MSGIWGVADRDQIPLRKEVVDGFDLILVFTPITASEEKQEYARNRLKSIENSESILKEQEEGILFLRKSIEYAKSFVPQLNEEAEAMIINFWSHMRGTNRNLESIIRVSKAFGRLHFSHVVDATFAKEAIEYMAEQFNEFDRNIIVVQNPRDAACTEIINFLIQHKNIPYDFQDLIDYASTVSKLVETWIGKPPIDNNSSKYRDIADRFRQGLVGKGTIFIENMHPLRLIYREADKNDERQDVQK